MNLSNNNIDYWFAKDVMIHLSVIHDFINSISDESIQNFCRVAFSESIREASWTRNGEFKLYRMSSDKITSFKPDIFNMFEQKILRNLKGIKEYQNNTTNDSASRVFDFNTVEDVPIDIITPQSADIVVTSPPYGIVSPKNRTQNLT